MSDVALQPGPTKRVFAPGPRQDATRLFERPGPVLTICVHQERGFMIGTRRGTPVWSHDDTGAPRPSLEHPDAYRTASSWADDATARAALVPLLKRSEWRRVMFASVRADVAETPAGSEGDVDSYPLAMCSLEACHRATRLFPPADHHRLDAEMRRLPRRPGPAVTLPRVGFLEDD